jgi:hypothetical protein
MVGVILGYSINRETHEANLRKLSGRGTAE